jgi:hypothetical protein
MRALKLVAAVAVLATPGIAWADDAGAGAWKIDGMVEGKGFVITCHFDRHGDALGGACYDGGTNLKHALKAGAVTADQVKWTYTSHFGLIPFDVTYDGKLSGGAMHGTIVAAGHNGTFAGAKQ